MVFLYSLKKELTVVDFDKVNKELREYTKKLRGDHPVLVVEKKKVEEELEILAQGIAAELVNP